MAILITVVKAVLRPAMGVVRQWVVDLSIFIIFPVRCCYVGWRQGAKLASAEVLEAGAWRRLPDLPVPGYTAAAWLGGRLYALVVGDEAQGFFALEPGAAGEARGWQPLAAPPAGARRGVALAAGGGKLFAVGGDGRETSVERYDPSAKRWEALPPLPAGVGWAGAAWLQGALYVVGGASSFVAGGASLINSACILPA